MSNVFNSWEFGCLTVQDLTGGENVSNMIMFFDVDSFGVFSYEKYIYDDDYVYKSIYDFDTLIVAIENFR